MYIGRISSHMIPTTTVLDTGAGSNNFNLRMLHNSWRSSTRQVLTPLLDESNKPIHCVGTIMLNFRLIKFKVRVRFPVVANLAVDAILGTTFICKHVRAILSTARRVVFHHGSPITITDRTLSKS